MAMETRIIDGKKIAREIEDSIRSGIEKLKTRKESGPGLVSIIVGNDAESHKFVDLKGQAAERVGVNFTKKAYPRNFDPRLVVDYIKEKNSDPDTHGILVQLPLPKNFDRTQILKTIHPYKDVDALHPKSLGLLIQNQLIYLSPVVQAIFRAIREGHLLERRKLPRFASRAYLQNGAGGLVSERMVAELLRGKNITIVGAGLLVGRPLAIFLINAGATVTVANRHTQDLPSITRQAEILISATGQENLITAEHIGKGAIVIDAARDVDTPAVTGKAAVLSPSPGGIGPLTIAYLLANTVLSWRQAR